MRPEPLARYFRIDGCPALKVAVGQLILGSCGLRRRRLRLRRKEQDGLQCQIYVSGNRLFCAILSFVSLYRRYYDTSSIISIQRAKNDNSLLEESELRKAIDKRSRRMIFRSVTMQVNLVSCVDYSFGHKLKTEEELHNCDIHSLVGIRIHSQMCASLSLKKFPFGCIKKKFIHPTNPPGRIQRGDSKQQPQTHLSIIIIKQALLLFDR